MKKRKTLQEPFEIFRLQPDTHCAYVQRFGEPRYIGHLFPDALFCTILLRLTLHVPARTYLTPDVIMPLRHFILSGDRFQLSK